MTGSNENSLSSFESDFCNGTFWDFSLVWNVEQPDFTGCFQKTIFSWVPLVTILFFSLFELPGYFSKQNKNRNIRLNYYNISKFILILCLIGVNIGQLVCFGITDGDNDETTRLISPADYAFGASYLASHIISFCLFLLF